MKISAVEKKMAKYPPPSTESKKMGRDSFTTCRFSFSQHKRRRHGTGEGTHDIGEQEDDEDPMPALLEELEDFIRLLALYFVSCFGQDL
jgi:hypothetical protein